MTRIDNPSTQKFRNAVALLHPGSVIRFVLDDGTELEVIAVDKSQAFSSSKGSDTPTEAPAMMVFLKRIQTRVPFPKEVKKCWDNAFDEGGKVIRHLEKAPPNSGD